MVTNLSQLKKALVKGARFEMVEHFLKPEYTGQKRVVQVVQTNAIYSGILGEPENPLSVCNYGKGLFMQFGKASDWKFDNGLCTCNLRGKPCFTLRLLSVDENVKEDMSV